MKIVMFLLAAAVTASTAWAGDAVTVIFKSGQIVYLREGGYQKVIDAVRGGSGGKFVELTVNGGTFLLSVEDIALVCRDDCRNIVVSHQQDPKRAQN